MSEAGGNAAAGNAAAARLDELAAVTREYAKYSRTTFGLAPAWVGVWLVLVAVGGVLLEGWGPNLARITPLVWLAALAGMRKRYQRHGEVMEEEEVPFPIPSAAGARQLHLTALWFFCVVGIVEASRSGVATLTLAAAVLVAISAIAALTVKGFVDGAFTVGVTFATTGAPARSLDGSTLPHAMLAAFAVFLIAAGLWEHGRYRRLERRLAALRGTP